MTTKTIEVRDRATFIPMLATRLDPTNEADRYLFALSGYGVSIEDQKKYVLLAQINGGNGKTSCDPYDWANRTLTTAHSWLIDHFDEIESGAVVDVQFILGETDNPKVSEAVQEPL